MCIHVQVKINARSYIYTIIYIHKARNAHTHICTHKIHVNKCIYTYRYILTHTVAHIHSHIQTYT